MTTIVALQLDGACVFAADSQTTDGNNKSYISKVGKITQNGECLIAGAGTLRGLNLLAFEFETPKRNKSWSLDSYLTRQFIPVMRKTFIDNGYEVKPDNSEATFDNVLLISITGVIYSIDQAYGWERTDSKIYCSGSGSEKAWGALRALGAEECTTVEAATDLLYEALKITSERDNFTGGHIQVAVQYADGKTTLALIDEE